MSGHVVARELGHVLGHGNGIDDDGDGRHDAKCQRARNRRCR
jgi:hypothetical protein